LRRGGKRQTSPGRGVGVKRKNDYVQVIYRQLGSNDAMGKEESRRSMPRGHGADYTSRRFSRIKIKKNKQGRGERER